MKDKLLHTPEGVRDIYGKECRAKLYVESQLLAKMRLYGFESIETPTFEYFDIFSEERGSVSAKDMYKFFDREGNTLVLRPDITPSIARCIAKYYRDCTGPVRLSYHGQTFINSNEYQGKPKEFTQIGAELVNDASVEADAEMIALTVECMLAAGIPEFQIEIGEVGFFKAIVRE
ncbi:MAG: ATP phosphoribosyltransferase regulatory subunit, partial [Lachnospiraceae bacterium]|nr:ATP phosphoribosyltransferase regulatory subunit [Lachnospiraceae bacterium]